MSSRYNLVKEFVVKPVAKVVKKVFKSRGKDPTPGTINTVPIAKRLTDKRKAQDDVIKTRDKIFSNYKIEDAAQKTELRAKANQPKINKKMADIYDKKAKGGRIGLKSGTNPFGRKSNIKKIQEAFGPKQVKKKEKPKARMMAKKGSKPKKKFPDLNKDGKTTFADVLIGRGVIKGKKKKTKKKFI